MLRSGFLRNACILERLLFAILEGMFSSIAYAPGIPSALCYTMAEVLTFITSYHGRNVLFYLKALVAHGYKFGE